MNAGGVRADFVHKMVVVRNQEHFAFPVAQEPAEPAHRHDVEVVRRLVKQEHVGLARQDLRKVQADLETAGQKHRALVHGFFVESEAEQDRLHLVFFEPAVFVGLEYAAGFFVHGRVREVDMLLQIAERILLGNVDGAAVEAFLPEDHLEQSRLAAAVAAHEPHALMVAHEQGRTVQKDLYTEGLGNVLDLDHGDKFRKKQWICFILFIFTPKNKKNGFRLLKFEGRIPIKEKK